jgi:hypothetical protein
MTLPPTIRPIDDHRDCWRLAHGPSWWGRPGDLRKCPHGRLQVRTEVSGRSRSMGPGTDWWRDLSPIWTPILYRRALRAWNGDKR